MVLCLSCVVSSVASFHEYFPRFNTWNNSPSSYIQPFGGHAVRAAMRTAWVPQHGNYPDTVTTRSRWPERGTWMVDDPFADGIYSWKYILAQVDSGSSMSCFESFPDFYVRLPLVAYYENNTLNPPLSLTSLSRGMCVGAWDYGTFYYEHTIVTRSLLVAGCFKEFVFRVDTEGSAVSLFQPRQAGNSGAKAHPLIFLTPTCTLLAVGDDA